MVVSAIKTSFFLTNLLLYFLAHRLQFLQILFNKILIDNIHFILQEIGVEIIDRCPRFARVRNVYFKI